MPGSALMSALQILALAGAGLTVAKLYATGLRRVYPVFFWYFVFRILNSTWPLLLDVQSRLYEKVWVCTEPIGWIFLVLTVRELYRLILRRLPGIYTAGRWAMYVCSLLSITISLVSLMHRIVPRSQQVSSYIPYVLAVDRGLDLSLALFILLLLVFLSWYPAPLNRNVVVHVTLYSVYFLSNTFGVLMRAIFGIRINLEVNLFLVAVSAACTWGWFFLLSPKGEETRAALPWLGPEAESRLLAQLDALNSTLVKASRN